MTFVAPLLTHRDDPAVDLDMASYSLVKSYEDRLGTRYAGMPWELKQSFTALAGYYANAPLTDRPTEQRSLRC